MDKFYTVKELAEYLNVSHSVIRKLIRSGRIQAVNYASEKRPQYRIYDGALQKFMADEYER